MGYGGRIGYGKILPVNGSEEMFAFELWGPLWYLSELTSPPGNHPPILFRNLVDDQYQEILGLCYDPRTPPLFVRGLEWDDLPEEATPKDTGNIDAAAAAAAEDAVGDDGPKYVKDPVAENLNSDAKAVNDDKESDAGDDAAENKKNAKASKFHPRNIKV